MRLNPLDSRVSLRTWVRIGQLCSSIRLAETSFASGLRDDVDIADARLLLSKFQGDRQQVWSLVEPHIIPGRELKARYAFDDLWDLDRGPS